MAITVTPKTCTGCGEHKPLDSFPVVSARPDGRHTRCRECRTAVERRRVDTPERKLSRRQATMRWRYGVEADLLQALYESQEGCCAICGAAGGQPLGHDRRATLCVDHDHATGQVRGLLCRNCNSALGKFGDSVDRLVKAAAYLLDRGGQ